MGPGGNTGRDPYTVTVSAQVGMVQGLAYLLDARMDAHVSPMLATILQYCMRAESAKFGMVSNASEVQHPTPLNIC